MRVVVKLKARLRLPSAAATFRLDRRGQGRSPHGRGGRMDAPVEPEHDGIRGWIGKTAAQRGGRLAMFCWKRTWEFSSGAGPLAGTE